MRVKESPTTVALSVAVCREIPFLSQRSTKSVQLHAPLRDRRIKDGRDLSEKVVKGPAAVRECGDVRRPTFCDKEQDKAWFLATFYKS